MDLEYTFEPMGNSKFQVRLKGEFICYTDNKDSVYVDNYLKQYGFNSREEYLKYCLESYIGEYK